MDMTRRCTKCGQMKSLAEFYPDPIQKYGVRPDCKPCHRQALRERYASTRKKPRSPAPNHRNTPRAVRSPTIVEIARAAGFIDGEGCFSGKHRGPYVRITASQKNRWFPAQLQEIFGGAVYERADGMFLWAAYGPRARGILMTIFSFMSPWRKAQIQEALRSEQTATSIPRTE